MDTDKRREILSQLGATSDNIDTLLNYTSNVFTPCTPDDDSGLLEKWSLIIRHSENHGPAAAINQWLVPEDLQIVFMLPEGVVKGIAL